MTTQDAQAQQQQHSVEIIGTGPTFGYWAYCSCSWTGPVRNSKSWASRDFGEHLAYELSLKSVP